jgi:predicted transcriptional regulator
MSRGTRSFDAIYLGIIHLIEAKSKKDNVRFTSSQLANALQVPRSLIQRLIHPDPNKRIVNPRVDTLIKIVDYFRKEGITASLDELTSS